MGTTSKAPAELSPRQEIRIHSTKTTVRIERRGSARVGEVCHYGLYAGEAGAASLSRYLADCLIADALVIRLDAAVLAMASLEVSDPAVYAMNPTPGAFVVLPEQFELVAGYARKLAALGVIRVVFLASQLALAHRWAAIEGAARRQ